jgi:hypothetical protein
MGSIKVRTLGDVRRRFNAEANIDEVSDVFAGNGGSESTLWEFKHGNGNFKRGDLVGLREIKRRASRQTLARDLESRKPPPSQPGTPAEPMPISDGPEPRLGGIEHFVLDLDRRSQQSQQDYQYMMVKQQALTDTITRLLHFNQELTRTVLQLVPPESPVYRNGMSNSMAQSFNSSLTSG